jgi:hypothetical protein
VCAGTSAVRIDILFFGQAISMLDAAGYGFISRVPFPGYVRILL